MRGLEGFAEGGGAGQTGLGIVAGLFHQPNLRKRLSRLTRSRPLARPSRAFTVGRIPFAVSHTAQVRVANPERLPRQIIRLLHRVTRIEWDECRSDEAARNREELLICVLNPRFNGAGKVWPRRASLEFKVQGSRFKIQSSKAGTQGSKFKVQRPEAVGVRLKAKG